MHTGMEEVDTGVVGKELGRLRTNAQLKAAAVQLVGTILQADVSRFK